METKLEYLSFWQSVLAYLVVPFIFILMLSGCDYMIKPNKKNPKAYCEAFAKHCECPCQPIPLPELTPDQQKLKKWGQDRNKS